MLTVNTDNHMRRVAVPSAGLRVSASALAVTLILIIALLAATSLWVLLRLYGEAYRESATIAALQHGVNISRYLAGQPVLTESLIAPSEFERFADVLISLGQVEESLGYVTIMEEDTVIYHKQFDPLRGIFEKSSGGDRIIIGRKKMADGASIVPMITFTRRLRLDDGRERRLEMALRKEILDREHAVATSAVTTMFIAALVIIGTAFGVCLLIIVWLLHRESKWQGRRRQSEHLAFAGAMAASVIHDFRNPMSALQLDAQMLQKEVAKGVDRERVASLAGRISKTVSRTDDLLKEFLLLSRPESAGIRVFDVNSCLNDCLELMKPRFDNAGIALEFERSQSSLPIAGSPMQLKRAFLNVLNNAAHFAPGGTAVTVMTSIRGKVAVVEIRDRGPGIPSDAERNRVFDFFFSTRPGGTGIGLALARAAVENCGGRIDCRQPESGSGSLFIIEMPLCKR